MEIPRLSVREAFVNLTLHRSDVLRDPAKHNSIADRESVEQLQMVVDYVHKRGLNKRFLEHLGQSIPEHARGPVMPELSFEMECPPQDQIRRVHPAGLAEVVQLVQPLEPAADLPSEQVA